MLIFFGMGFLNNRNYISYYSKSKHCTEKWQAIFRVHKSLRFLKSLNYIDKISEKEKGIRPSEICF